MTDSVRRHVMLPAEDDRLLLNLIAHFRRGPSWVVRRALHALEQQRVTGARDPAEVLAACRVLREAGHPGYRMLADVERAAGAAVVPKET